MTHSFASVADLVSRARPSEPVYAFRPHAISAAARAAVACFPGSVAYAVKCNPRPEVLLALRDGGVRAWDVASIEEVRAAAAADPGGEIVFMNPVKAPEHVAEASLVHGVSEFAVDDAAEVDMVARMAGGPPPTITVRLAVPRRKALLDLSGKFGAEPGDAVALLRMIAGLGLRAGLTFHVGSQCLDVADHSNAVSLCAGVAREAGVLPAVLDVGGGFPARYEGHEPPFADFADTVAAAFRAAGLGGCRLRCEPGRALAAPGMSVVTRVEAVRRARRLLHLNDGAYGALSEVKALPCRFPVRAYRPDGSLVGGPEVGWALAGPTCDSADMMPGPHPLPDSVSRGDYVEFGLLGAYSCALETRFNGFGPLRWAMVADAPDWRAANPE